MTSRKQEKSRVLSFFHSILILSFIVLQWAKTDFGREARPWTIFAEFCYWIPFGRWQFKRGHWKFNRDAYHWHKVLQAVQDQRQVLCGCKNAAARSRIYVMIIGLNVFHVSCSLVLQILRWKTDWLQRHLHESWSRMENHVCMRVCMRAIVHAYMFLCSFFSVWIDGCTCCVYMLCAFARWWLVCLLLSVCA